MRDREAVEQALVEQVRKAERGYELSSGNDKADAGRRGKQP